MNSGSSPVEAMTALGLALIVVALALLLAEAHLSTGGLIGAAASAAAIGGVALLLLAAGAGAAVVLIVALCAAAAATSLLLLARRRILRPLRAAHAPAGRRSSAMSASCARVAAPSRRSFSMGRSGAPSQVHFTKTPSCTTATGSSLNGQRLDLVRAQGRGMGAESVIVTIVLIVLAVLLLLGLILAAASVRILREYERGVISGSDGCSSRRDLALCC